MGTAWHDRPWPLRVAALVLAAALALATQWLLPGATSMVEEGVGDLAWRVAAHKQPERRVVVVDIDERSVQQHGAWPWPRATVAQLVQRLHAHGVAVQGLDIVFPEVKPGDEQLAAALQRAPTVLGQIFSLDPSAVPDVGAAAGAAGSSCAEGLPISNGMVANAASLVGPLQAAGHLTPRVEGDGVVRKIPALICHQGKPYATLALAALARAAGGDHVAASDTPAWLQRSATSGGPSYPALLAPAQWLQSSALPGVVVPLDAEGNLRVPYGRAREALMSVSAADVLAGRADQRLLQGAVALIGATAFGIGDTVATPLSPVASGVEVHAQLTAGLLDGRIVYTPRVAPVLQVALAFVIGLALLGLTSLAVHRSRSSHGATATSAGNSAQAMGVRGLPAAGLLLAVLCALLGAGAPVVASLWLPWSGAALFALLGSAALLVTEHAISRAQRERLSAHLGAYLPAPMAARLAAIDPTGHLEAQRRQVTVLVADIRNFSAFAVHQPAEQTAAVLHAFSCVAVDIVERHGGVVENLVGDSVLAMWNAYGGAGADGALTSPDSARKALAAARELLTATQELLATAHTDGHEASVVQPLALGIGLECGDAIVGSFGPARRRTHAALGEPVTVAVRLQSMTQDLSVPILVGPRLAASLPAEQTVSQGEYLLQGLSRHCELFAPAAWAEWAGPETVFPPGRRQTEADDLAGELPSGLALGMSSARASGDL